MATSERDVKFRIGVETTGTDSVGELADDLKGVVKAGKDAAPSLDAMSAELAILEARTKALRAAETAARSDLAAAKSARAEMTDALAKLRAETDRSAKSSDDFRTKERALTLGIIESRAAVRAKQSALDQATVAARVAAAAESDLAAKIKATAVQQAASQTSLKAGLQDIAGQLRTIQQLAVAAVGGTYLGGLAKDALQTADAFNNLAARIKLVTGEGPAFEQAFQGVFDISNRTSTAVEQTGTLFARLAEAGKSAGLSAKDASTQALALTETINEATQLSGASAESSNAAIIQLIQGLQSGVLRGEEFNSVMEQAPRLARALADGLGVTTGELRKMAAAGALTTETVINALQGQSAALKREFEQIPPTVGRAIQQLSNSWLEYVGHVDSANGVSTKAAQAISMLATHLDTLGNVLYSAGKAAVAFKAWGLASTFLGISTAARAATVEITAMSAAQTAAGASAGVAGAGVGRFAAALASIKIFSLFAVLTNLREIGTAIGEGVAKWAGYGKALEDAERNAKAQAEATRAAATQQAELAQKLQMASDRALGLTDVSRKLIAEFDGLRKKGESVTEAMGKVAKSLDFSDLAGIANAGAALDALAVKGQISAHDIQTAYSTALKGIDLGTFATNAAAAFDGSEQGARRLKAAVDAIGDEALRRAGSSVRELQGGFSVAMASAINDVDMLVKTLDRLGIKGTDAGRVLSTSLNKALDLATTEQAVNAVIERMEALGKAGLLTGDQLAAGLDKARGKLDQIKPGVDSLAEALKNLGIVSDKTLTDTARKSKEAYDYLTQAGTASARELAEAFKKSADAAIAANAGVAPSWVLAQAATRGYTVEVDAAGRATVRAAHDGRRALGELGEHWRMTTASVEEQTEAMDRLLMRYKLAADYNEREKKLAEKDQADADKGNRFKGTFTNALPIDKAVAVRQKVERGTLSAADLEDVRAALQQAVALQQFINATVRDSPGSVSTQAIQDAAALVAAATTALERVTAMQAPGQAGTTPNSTVTVNVNLGGKTTAVNVASKTDAQSLTELLRALESGRGTAA